MAGLVALADANVRLQRIKDDGWVALQVAGCSCRPHQREKIKLAVSMIAVTAMYLHYDAPCVSRFHLSLLPAAAFSTPLFYIFEAWEAFKQQELLNRLTMGNTGNWSLAQTAINRCFYYWHEKPSALTKRLVQVKGNLSLNLLKLIKLSNWLICVTLQKVQFYHWSVQYTVVRLYECSPVKN